MRAVVQRRYEVLVRVRAAGLDPSVWHLVTGLPYMVRLAGYGLRSPRRSTPGQDVAGEVERVGKDGGRIGGGLQRQVRAALTSPFVTQTLIPFIARPDRADLLVLSSLLESCVVSPVLDRPHRLEEVPELLSRLERGHARGKTVISL